MKSTHGTRAAMAIGLLVLASACGQRESAPASAEDARLIEAQENLLRSRLRAPDSASFRNVYVSRSGGNTAVCGEINALNSFGAYTGFQRFIIGDAIKLLESDGSSDEMDKAWQEHCGR